jgi:hypothetical protein
MVAVIYFASPARADNPPSAIFVMKVDGSEVRKIAEAPGYDDHSCPRWSHDGREMAEQWRRLLGLLDDELQRIALAKVHGLTNEEIARQDEMSMRSVERKRNIIRKIWAPEVDA